MYSLEPTYQGGSNKYPQSMFLDRIMQTNTSLFVCCCFFLSENFQFLEVKFSIYFNRRVFVMLFAIFFCSGILLQFWHTCILCFIIVCMISYVFCDVLLMKEIEHIFVIRRCVRFKGEGFLE